MCFRALAFGQPWFAHWDHSFSIFAGAIYWGAIASVIRERHWARRWYYVGIFFWAVMIWAAAFNLMLVFWFSIIAMIALQEILLYPPSRGDAPGENARADV
jgi:hypothetical protein